MSSVDITWGRGDEVLGNPSWNEFASTAGSIFQDSGFLLPWWRDTAMKNPSSEFLAATFMDGGEVIGFCAFELKDDALFFAGGQDVVDYMGPAVADGRETAVAEAVVRLVFDELQWERAHLAGLPAGETLTQALTEAVRSRAPKVAVEMYDQAPRILSAPEGYLGLLNSKRRGEVLRKRKRLVEEFGPVEVTTSTPDTWSSALEQLLDWKASAAPAMRDFVTEYGDLVRNMVKELAPKNAAHVVELRTQDHAVASAIVLTHRRTKYLYNMSYDISAVNASHNGLAPGVVLVSYLAEDTLAQGLVFDFLKGAQGYKVRLGGVPEDIVALSFMR
ncbi:GNAT family N-acetyltransferase [Streptomyces sp. NPDC059816]|uniref:GNAT family N-acetyltransferase n=1 Tax=Streptomyces sp. NPDC059816 TaxID=3346960 RepID=UPI00364FC3D9